MSVCLCVWSYVCSILLRRLLTKTVCAVLQDVMEEWAMCQKSWLYLEPIFSSDDIMRQLPVEGKRYQTMDRMWRKMMMAAKQDPKVHVWHVCACMGLLHICACMCVCMCVC